MSGLADLRRVVACLASMVCPWLRCDEGAVAGSATALAVVPCRSGCLNSAGKLSECRRIKFIGGVWRCPVGGTLEPALYVHTRERTSIKVCVASCTLHVPVVQRCHWLLELAPARLQSWVECLDQLHRLKIAVGVAQYEGALDSRQILPIGGVSVFVAHNRICDVSWVLTRSVWACQSADLPA